MRKRIVGGGENFASTGAHWSEIADFEPLIARSALAVTPSD